MKLTRIRLTDRYGRSRIGTKVRDGNRNYIFDSIVTDAAAARAIQKIGGSQARRVKKSIQSFRRFNRKDPTKIIRQAIDVKTPFVRIGDVPMITYMSDKTGSMKAYKHETRIMPVLYLHPSKPIGILLGGSLKVKEWLEG